MYGKSSGTPGNRRKRAKKVKSRSIILYHFSIKAISKSGNSMTNEELVTRLQGMEPDTRAAREILTALWEQNAGLVRQTVHRLTGLDYGNVDFPDMEQQAFFGLRAAAYAYDTAGAAKFSTYAVKRIEWELSSYYERSGYAVRVPAYMRQRMRECMRRKKAMEAERGHGVQLETVLSEMGLSEREIKTTLSAFRKLETLSLEAPAPNTDGLTLADTIAAEGSIEGEGMAPEWHRELHALLSKALREVPAAARGVVVRHYFAGVSLTEQAREMGLTLEAMRQRESRAFRKIRRGRYAAALAEFASTQGEKRRREMLIQQAREKMELLKLSEREKGLLL